MLFMVASVFLKQKKKAAPARPRRHGPQSFTSIYLSGKDMGMGVRPQCKKSNQKHYRQSPSIPPPPHHHHQHQRHPHYSRFSFCCCSSFFCSSLSFFSAISAASTAAATAAAAAVAAAALSRSSEEVWEDRLPPLDFVPDTPFVPPDVHDEDFWVKKWQCSSWSSVACKCWLFLGRRGGGP